MFIESISLASGGKLNILGHRQQEQKMINNIDEIIANTGARPDFQFLKEIRHTFDSALEVCT